MARLCSLSAYGHLSAQRNLHPLPSAAVSLGVVRFTTRKYRTLLEQMKEVICLDRKHVHSVPLKLRTAGKETHGGRPDERKTPAVCQLLHGIVHTQALPVNTAAFWSASMPSRRVGVHSLLNRPLPGNVRAMIPLSFMSSLYPMLLLGNILEIAMETCPMI